MSIVDDTGAYLVGRVAGKMAGKVEAKNEAQAQIFALEDQLTHARNAIKLWQQKEIKDRASYVELAAAAAIHKADFEGLNEVSGVIRTETSRLAAYLVENGSISGEELARLAPVTIERRLAPEQRVLGRRIRRQGFLDFVANNQEITENGHDIWQGISFTPEERERILGRIAEHVEKYL
jgi:hypothetical protein